MRGGGHDRHGDAHGVAQLRGADRLRRVVDRAVRVRDGEAAVQRLDVLGRRDVAQVERVVEPPGFRVVARERDQARRPGLHDRERHRLRRGRRRRVRLDQSREDLALVELHLVAVVAGELAGLHRVAREREHGHRPVDRCGPAVRAARDDEPPHRLRDERVLRLDAGERERHERGRRHAGHERAARRFVPVVAVRARDRRRGEIVEERAHLRVVLRGGGVGEREQQVRAAPVAKLRAVLLEEGVRGRRRGDVATGGRERREQERLLVDGRRVRDVGLAVHEAEHVAGAPLHDARVDAQAIALRLAEREEHPAGHVRIGRARGIVAPGPATVGALPADEPGEVARDLGVTRGRDVSALLGATDRDRRDEPARHALGALVDVGHEHGELLGHRAGERRLHRDAERPVLRVGERR